MHLTNRPASAFERRFMIVLGAGLLGLILPGCGSIGPDTVQRDRIDYADALSDSLKDQMLLNIVRLRYGDTPTFIDVSSVITTYAIQAQLSAGVSENYNIPARNTDPRTSATLGAAAAYGDKPTISYTPLTGKQFAKSLLEPLPPAAIFSLLAAGYPADLVLPVTVRALNGVYNGTSLDGVKRPGDANFVPLVQALQRIQHSRAFSLRIEKKKDRKSVIGVFATGRGRVERQDFEWVQKLLNLKSDNGEVEVVYGATQRNSRELAVLSRSMLEIMREVASDIEVPPDHVMSGRTYANAAPGAVASPLQSTQLRIHAAAAAPDGAFSAVFYRGSWYWISDTDFESKRTLTFLLLFFSLAETGAVPAAPLLTLPVQ